MGIVPQTAMGHWGSYLSPLFDLFSHPSLDSRISSEFGAKIFFEELESLRFRCHKSSVLLLESALFCAEIIDSAWCFPALRLFFYELNYIVDKGLIAFLVSASFRIIPFCSSLSSGYKLPCFCAK